MAGKRAKEKARRALPFTPDFLEMAVEKLANDQTFYTVEFNLESKLAKILAGEPDSIFASFQTTSEITFSNDRAIDAVFLKVLDFRLSWATFSDFAEVDNYFVHHLHDIG